MKLLIQKVTLLTLLLSFFSACDGSDLKSDSGELKANIGQVFVNSENQTSKEKQNVTVNSAEKQVEEVKQLNDSLESLKKDEVDDLANIQVKIEKNPSSVLEEKKFGFKIELKNYQEFFYKQAKLDSENVYNPIYQISLAVNEEGFQGQDGTEFGDIADVYVFDLKNCQNNKIIQEDEATKDFCAKYFYSDSEEFAPNGDWPRGKWKRKGNLLFFVAKYQEELAKEDLKEIQINLD